jgi:hypothetical protein
MMNVARQTGHRFLAPLASSASLAVLGFGVVTLASCEEEPTVPVAVPMPVPVPPTIRDTCRPLQDAMTSTMKALDEDSKAKDDSTMTEKKMAMAIAIKGASNVIRCMEEHFLGAAVFDLYEADQIKKNQTLPLSWSGLDVDWSKVWEYAKATNLTLDDFGATPIQWKPFLSGVFGQRDLDDYVAGRNVVSKEREIILGNTVRSKVAQFKDYMNEDPKLIEVNVRINLFDADGSPLLMSYAKDQSGTVLGYDKFEDQKEGGAKEDVLRLYVEPGKTMSVKLYKVYQGKDDERRIYVSKAKYLVEAAFEAGLE